jgi:hypothetical protein
MSLMFGPFVAGEKATERSPVSLDPARFHSRSKTYQCSYSPLKTAPVPPGRREVLELSDSEDEEEPHDEHKVRKLPSSSSTSHMGQHLTALFCLVLPY